MQNAASLIPQWALLPSRRPGSALRWTLSNRFACLARQSVEDECERAESHGESRTERTRITSATKRISRRAHCAHGLRAIDPFGIRCTISFRRLRQTLPQSCRGSAPARGAIKTEQGPALRAPITAMAFGF